MVAGQKCKGKQSLWMLLVISLETVALAGDSGQRRKVHPNPLRRKEEMGEAIRERGYRK